MRVYDMEAYIYNKSLELEGITHEIASVKWKRQFFSGDSFQLIFPATEKNLRLIKKERIVEFPGKYGGFITALRIYTDSCGRKLILAGGTSFDGMLSRRVIAGWLNAETVMTILDKNAGSAAEDRRRFENTVFDLSVDCPSCFSSGMKYMNIGNYLALVGGKMGFGVLSELVPKENGMSIRIYGKYGTDRSVSQNVLPPVVFSEEYGNMSSCGYSYNEAGAADSVYCFSLNKFDGEKHIDIMRFSYCTPTEKSGYFSLEKAEEISPVTMTELRGSGSSAVKWEVLDIDATKEKAEEKAASMIRSVSDSLNASVIIGGDYRESFDMGDIVTVYDKSRGAYENRRICGITEIYSGSSAGFEVSLGAEQPEERMIE